MNNLQNKYDDFINYLNNYNNTEILYFISNYLLNISQYYLNIDKKLNLISNDIELNFDDFESINEVVIFNKKANSLQLAYIAHQLLFINKQYQLKEQNIYTN